MNKTEPAVDWARTMEFSTPLKWGDVEAAILSQAAPSLGGRYAGPITAKMAVGRSGITMMLLGVVLVAAPLIGLGLVLTHMKGVLEGDGVLRVAFYAFVAAASNLLLVVLSWTEDRKGSRSMLALVGVTALVSTVAYLVVRTGSDTYAEGRLPVLTLGVSIAAWVLLPVIAFGSRRWARYTRPRDRPDQTEIGAGYMGARVAVIEILIKRGLVDRRDVDITEMMEMPLGTWRELDSEQR